MKPRRRIIGRHTVADLVQAMRVVLARADLRALRAKAREQAVDGYLVPFDAKERGAMINLWP